MKQQPISTKSIVLIVDIKVLYVGGKLMCSPRKLAIYIENLVRFLAEIAGSGKVIWKTYQLTNSRELNVNSK